MQQEAPQGKNPEPSDQPAEPDHQRVSSQNSPKARHPEGVPVEEHGSENVIQHIPNSPAEISHQGNYQKQGIPGDPCGTRQHKTESRVTRIDLHTETSNSKRSPPDNRKSDSEGGAAEQRTSTRAESPEEAAQNLRLGTSAGQPQGNANTPGERGSEPTLPGGTSKQDSAAIVGSTARAQPASCEQRHAKAPGLEALTPAVDSPQADAVKSPARDQKQTPAAGSSAFLLVEAPPKGSGLAERQPPVNEARDPQLEPKPFSPLGPADRQPAVDKARDPQLQPASVSPPQDVASFQRPPSDQHTDQKSHKSYGLAERQPSVNKARGPQLQSRSVSPPQEVPSFQRPSPDQQTDQKLLKHPPREFQNNFDSPLPAKPMPQTSIPADSVAQGIQVRTARGSTAQLPCATAPACAAEARAGSSRVAGQLIYNTIQPAHVQCNQVMYSASNSNTMQSAHVRCNQFIYHAINPSTVQSTHLQHNQPIYDAINSSTTQSTHLQYNQLIYNTMIAHCSPTPLLEPQQGTLCTVCELRKVHVAWHC